MQIMPLSAYKQSVMEAQTEAQQYAAKSALKYLTPALQTAQWDDFYENSANQMARVAYDIAKKSLAKELSAPIVEAIKNGNCSEAEFFRHLDQAEERFHYRFLALLGKQPTEINPGWVSKHIARHVLLENIKSDTQSDFVEKARSSWIFRDSECQMTEWLYDLPIGKRYITLSDAQEIGYTLKPSIQDLFMKAAPEEAMGVILNRALLADGMRPHYPKDEIVNFVVSKAARLAYGDMNIGMSDIARLREDKVLVPLRLWHTQYFQQHCAPANTEQSIEEAREYLQRSEYAILNEIKGELSRPELLSALFSSTGRNDLERWGFAMSAFEVLTGERLTFKEALELDPKPYFSLASTQAYSNRTDRLMDPDEYRKITVSVRPASDEHDQYGERAEVEHIYLDCKTLALDPMSNFVENMSWHFDMIKSYSPTQDGVFIEVVTEENGPLFYGSDLAKEMVKRLDALNKRHILPGDVVKVESEEAADYEIKNGTMAVVTDVSSNGDIKLKGDKNYYPASLFALKKKYQPDLNLGQSLGR
ncbi:hypothetical protein ACI2KR_06715 [Pseudomonas luteola]